MVTLETKTYASNIDHNFDAYYILLCKGIISNEEINDFLPPCRLHTAIMVWKYNFRQIPDTNQLLAQRWVMIGPFGNTTMLLTQRWPLNSSPTVVFK